MNYDLLSILLPEIQTPEEMAHWEGLFSSCYVDMDTVQTSSLLFPQTDCIPPRPDGSRCTVPIWLREKTS